MKPIITHLLFFGCALLSIFTCAAQDRLVLMNGNRLEVRILECTPAVITYEQEKKNGRLVTVTEDVPEVFSYTKKDSAETIIYYKDDMLGDILEVEEARYYIYGLGDAKEGYKTWPTIVGGLVTGAAGTIVAGEATAPLVVLPLVYSFGMQIPVVRVPPTTITDPKWKQYPTYLEGYNRKARNRKFKSAFLSTLSGVAIGSAVLLLTDG